MAVSVPVAARSKLDTPWFRSVAGSGSKVGSPMWAVLGNSSKPAATDDGSAILACAAESSCVRQAGFGRVDIGLLDERRHGVSAPGRSLLVGHLVGDHQGRGQPGRHVDDGPGRDISGESLLDGRDRHVCRGRRDA